MENTGGKAPAFSFFVHLFCNLLFTQTRFMWYDYKAIMKNRGF